MVNGISNYYLQLSRETGISPYTLRNQDRRAYLNKKAKELFWQNKLKAIKYLGGCCVNCGETNPEALEFHHLEGHERKGDENRRIAYVLKNSWDKILEELEGCEVLCNPCHRGTH